MDAPGDGNTVRGPSGPDLPPNILLVEDGPAELYLLRKTFATGPFPIHLESVTSVDEALRFLRHEEPYSQAPRPHLIVTSINMPGKSGFDLITEVKRDPALRPLPIVVFSSYSQPEIIHKSYALGANSYITKPNKYEAYCRAVHALMEYWLRVVTLCPAPA